MNAIADVLYAVRSVAGDHPSRRLVVKPKCGNPSVLAVKHPGLAIRSRRCQPAEPAPQREPLAEQARDGGAQPELERAAEIGVRQRVDLQHDQTALRRTRTFLTRE